MRFEDSKVTGDSLLGFMSEIGHHHIGEHLPPAPEGSGLHRHDRAERTHHEEHRDPVPPYVHQAAETGHASHAHHGDSGAGSGIFAWLFNGSIPGNFF